MKDEHLPFFCGFIVLEVLLHASASGCQLVVIITGDAGKLGVVRS